jgi:hypothetical protein
MATIIEHAKRSPSWGWAKPARCSLAISSRGGAAVRGWDPDFHGDLSEIPLAASFAAAVAGADIVISVNWATVAAAVAREALPLLRRGMLYADHNTAGPALKEELGRDRRAERRGVRRRRDDGAGAAAGDARRDVHGRKRARKNSPSIIATSARRSRSSARGPARRTRASSRARSFSRGCRRRFGRRSKPRAPSASRTGCVRTSSKRSSSGGRGVHRSPDRRHGETCRAPRARDARRRGDAARAGNPDDDGHGDGRIARTDRKREEGSSTHR